MDTPVNFEIAKLLKEKGYNIPTIAYRQKSAVKGDETILPLSIPNHEFYWTPVDWNNYSEQVPYYSMPTIAEVVMWIYEKQGVWIWVSLELGYHITFCWQLAGENTGSTFKQNFKNPTDAYQDAINFTLINIIK